MYLRLLCGVTLKPAVVYKIPVQTGDGQKKVAELLHKSARMLGIGLTVAATWNCAAGTAQLFGAPVPKVPGSWTNKLQNAQKVLEELQPTIDADVGAQAQQADAGMNRQELEDFAEYLRHLEARAGDQPRWKKELYPIQDPSPSARGRVTYTTEDNAGTFGGSAQKAAVDAYRSSSASGDPATGNVTAPSSELTTSEWPFFKNRLVLVQSCCWPNYFNGWGDGQPQTTQSVPTSSSGSSGSSVNNVAKKTFTV